MKGSNKPAFSVLCELLQNLFKHCCCLWEYRCRHMKHDFEKTKHCQVHKENRHENKGNIFFTLKFYHSAVLFLVVVDITFCRNKFDRSIQLAVLSFPVLIPHLANNPILLWELCSVTYKTTACLHYAFPFFWARDKICPTRPGIKTTQHVHSCLVKMRLMFLEQSNYILCIFTGSAI